jgi:two-component system, response regulator PdtaR
MKTSYKEYIATLNKISKAITSDLYLEDVLKLIVTLTAGALNAKICSLWLLDQNEGGLKIRATQAISELYLQDRILKIGEGVVGLVAKSKKPKVVKDVLKEKIFKEKTLAKKENLVSMLSVPMMIKNRVIGVINIYTNSVHDFTKSEIELLSAVANQAAVAIENTELLVKAQIAQAELEGRKKIERAKGILMREQNLDEDEAFKLMRGSSMDKRVSMKSIAEAIILSYDIRKSQSKRD